jgi:hypothetical protein
MEKIHPDPGKTTMRPFVRLSAALFLSHLAVSGLAQEVTLPLEDYESLRRRANPLPEPVPEPPAPFSIESAAIEIHPGTGSARVVQRLSIVLYANGWQRIPLPSSGTVTSVELGNLEGRIQEDGERALVVRGSGRHVVRVETLVPLVQDDVAARLTASLSAPLPRAASITGVVDLSGASAEVREIEIVSGALRRSPDEAGRFAFVGNPDDVLEIRLLGESRLPDRAGLPLQFEATSAALATLARTRTEVQALAQVEVLQGRLPSFRLRAPSGFDVAKVDAGESGWRLDGSTIVVTPPAPIEDRLSVMVTLQGGPLDEIEAPLLVPEEAARVTYATALSTEADGIATMVDAGSARSADEDELASLPSWLRAARVYRVRDPQTPPRWRIQWSDAGQEQVLAAQVDRLVVDALVGQAGRAAYQVRAFVRTSGATNLTLQLPEGFELSRVERDDFPVTPGVTAEGLEVPLGGGKGTQSLRITGVMPFAALPEKSGEIHIPLPSVSAPIGRAEVRAVLPGGRSYALVDSHVESSSLPPSMLTFPSPEGFAVVEASWTALSSAPKALAIRVKSRKEKRRWF